MTIPQISVFLENKFGRLNEILSILNKENIHVVAATVADTSDYGILRLITSDQMRAYKLLSANDVSANLNDVFAITSDSSIEKFSETIECFTNAGISIEYMYCFSCNKKAILILRCNAIEAAAEVVKNNGLNYLSETELSNL